LSLSHRCLEKVTVADDVRTMRLVRTNSESLMWDSIVTHDLVVPRRNGRAPPGHRHERVAGSIFHDEADAVVDDRSMTGSGASSRRLRAVMEARNFLRRIDRSADHFHGRSYLLLGRQQLPGRNCFLQCSAIGQSAGSVVQRSGPPGIDIDFVIFGLHCAPHSVRALTCQDGVCPMVVPPTQVQARLVKQYRRRLSRPRTRLVGLFGNAPRAQR